MHPLVSPGHVWDEVLFQGDIVFKYLGSQSAQGPLLIDAGCLIVIRGKYKGNKSQSNFDPSLIKFDKKLIKFLAIDLDPS